MMVISYIKESKDSNMSQFQNMYYPESVFGGFTHLDGTIAFYSRVNALLQPSSVVLDIGCGRGEYGDDPVLFRRKLRILKGKCKKVIGVDVDEIGEKNPFIDEFRRIESRQWPVEDQSVDLCLVDHVVEHIENPNEFFFECARVIKSGGYICIRTPNAHNYIATISRLIPNRFHARVLGKTQERRLEKDVFPVLYRCNTKRRLKNELIKCGFESCVLGYEAEPQYLQFSRAAYFLGVLHQRYAPSMFRAALFVFGKKK